MPYARYGESAEGVARTLRSAPLRLERVRELPAGAARDALDAALLDLEAKLRGVAVHALLGLPAPRPVATAFSVGVDAPAAMEAAARRRRGWPWLKLKADPDAVLARVDAVRRGAGVGARLIVDANESWSPEAWRELAPALRERGVVLVEQPLPVGEDAVLREGRAVPVCADESAHEAADVGRLAERYDLVNVKLGKAGGLRGALAVAAAARRRGLGVMVGCMVSTSLAIAPAMLVAGGADVVDLDGALLLARDRVGGLACRGPWLRPAPRSFWG